MITKEQAEEVKAYLSEIMRYDALIASKQEDMLYLDEMATKITAAWGGEVVSGSRGQDKLGGILAKKQDLARECADLLKKVDARKAVIEKVKNTEQMEILRLVYVGVWDADIKRFCALKWDEIGYRRHMSARNAQLIHGEALETVYKLLAENKSFR